MLMVYAPSGGTSYPPAALVNEEACLPPADLIDVEVLAYAGP